jgi:hypothetical protein
MPCRRRQPVRLRPDDRRSPRGARACCRADRKPARGLNIPLIGRARPARKTTELIAYVVAVLAVIVAAFVVGDDGANTADPFSAEQALRYITFLTIGYMIARGLAKSGSRARVSDNN